MIVKPERWLKMPDMEGSGLLQILCEAADAAFPMAVETHNVMVDDITLNQPQNFQFIFEAAQEVKVYKDEDDYEKTSNSNMACESVIPSGLFSAGNDPDFVQTGTAIITGRVTETYDDPTLYGFGSDTVLCSLTCLGFEMDAVIDKHLLAVSQFDMGNIVSGVFWVQGWPDDAE